MNNDQTNRMTTMPPPPPGQAPQKKKPFWKKWKFWVGLFAFVFVINLFSDDETKPVEKDEQAVEEQKQQEEVAQKEKELEKKEKELAKKEEQFKREKEEKQKRAEKEEQFKREKEEKQKSAEKETADVVPVDAPAPQPKSEPKESMQEGMVQLSGQLAEPAGLASDAMLGIGDYATQAGNNPFVMQTDDWILGMAANLVLLQKAGESFTEVSTTSPHPEVQEVVQDAHALGSDMIEITELFANGVDQHNVADIERATELMAGVGPAAVAITEKITAYQ